MAELQQSAQTENRRNFAALSEAIGKSRTTNWGALASWVGVAFMFAGLCGAWVLQMQGRNERDLTNLETRAVEMARKLEATTADTARGLDSMLQREIRLLTAPLDQRITTNKEAIDAFKARLDPMIAERFPRPEADRRLSELDARVRALEQRK